MSADNILMDRETAEKIAFQKASLKVSLGIIWAAGGTTEVFDFRTHLELKAKVGKAIRKALPAAKAEELAKLGYT